MKAWLKGGLIGIIILFCLIIPLIICDLNCSGENWCMECFIFALPINVGMIFAVPIGNKFLAYTVLVVANISIYFLIGALIGWIVGKVRAKKVEVKR